MAREKGIFLFNGVRPPTGILQNLRKQAEQLVDGDRNSLGQVIIQLISRRIEAYTQMEWGELTPEEFQWLRRNVEDMVVDLTFFNDLTQRVSRRRYYFGILNYRPMGFKDTGLEVLQPMLYVENRCNIIDMNLDN